MKVLTLKSLRNHKIIADQCSVADHFFLRLVGLMGRKDFSRGKGLLFPRCKSVHLWWMRIPIDIVFLNKKNITPRQTLSWEVSSVHKNVQPWTLFPKSDWRADDVLELPAGTIQVVDLRVGDEICIS